MCRSMVDIQSVTAEVRRGKKETGKKCNVCICYAIRTTNQDNIRQSRQRMLVLHATSYERH